MSGDRDVDGDSDSIGLAVTVCVCGVVLDAATVADTVVEPIVVTLLDCSADAVSKAEPVRDTDAETLGVNEEDELRTALFDVVAETVLHAEVTADAEDDAVAQPVREVRGDCDGVSVVDDKLLLLDVPVGTAAVAETESVAPTVADTEAVSGADRVTTVDLLDVFDAELDAVIENEAASLAERGVALADPHASTDADATPDAETLTVVDALESGEPVYVVLVVLVNDGFEAVANADLDASLLAVVHAVEDGVSFADKVFEPEGDCDTENDGERLESAERVLDVDARAEPLALGEPESGRERCALSEGEFEPLPSDVALSTTVLDGE